jgi:hypothetical protein
MRIAKSKAMAMAMAMAMEAMVSKGRSVVLCSVARCERAAMLRAVYAVECVLFALSATLEGSDGRESVVVALDESVNVVAWVWLAA